MSKLSLPFFNVKFKAAAFIQGLNYNFLLAVSNLFLIIIWLDLTRSSDDILLRVYN